MDRHHYRPAHIHLIVSRHLHNLEFALTLQVESKGHTSLTTQIFDENSNYLKDDSVFAVKDGLTVRFEPVKDDPKATWDLEYNVKLSKA